MSFNMQKVESSQISEIGRDPSNNTMRVVFKNGGKAYRYANVTQAIFEGLLAANSIGSAFSSVIKKNVAAFPCTPE